MNLLTVQTQGFLWCVLIAIICAVIVHGVKLAILGYRSLGAKPPEEPPKPQPQPEKPEPVYFLVERKKKKPKSEYSEPKQINFQ